MKNSMVSNSLHYCRLAFRYIKDCRARREFRARRIDFHVVTAVCKLGGLDVHVLLDTSSMKSFVSHKVYAQLCPKPLLAKTHQHCVSITGQPLVIVGSTQLELSFPRSGSVSYVGQFLVSSTLAPL